MRQMVQQGESTKLISTEYQKYNIKLNVFLQIIANCSALKGIIDMNK